MSLYSQLGFKFDDPEASIAVQPFSASVNSQMNLLSTASTTQNSDATFSSWQNKVNTHFSSIVMTTNVGISALAAASTVHAQYVKPALATPPVTPLLNSWQIQDMANNDVGGYFQNPVANVVQAIWNLSNTYITYNTNGLSNTTNATINTLIQQTVANAIAIANVYANTFVYVTNRESNVTSVGNDVTTIHYTTAMSQSKTATYIISMSDQSVQNNSIILGNFTSIMIGNTLNSLNTVFYTLSSVLANSVNTSSTPWSSNIDLANAQSLQSNVSALANKLLTFPQNDQRFFQNTATLINNYHSVRNFSSLGQSETQLINNYIGTPKLISRINK
jgi:hypothetical protein